MIEKADSEGENSLKQKPVLWRSLTELLQRRFSTLFTVNAYIPDLAERVV